MGGVVFGAGVAVVAVGPAGGVRLDVMVGGLGFAYQRIYCP